MAKEPDWKSGKVLKPRGFESHVLRHLTSTKPIERISFDIKGFRAIGFVFVSK